jgi:hypothetical protein
MSVISSTATNSTDHHSGWYFIPALSLVTLLLNKQMTVYGPLEIEGALIIEGQLIMEP